MLGIYIIQYIYEVKAIKLAFLSSEVQEITLGFNINCVQYNTGGFYCIILLELTIFVVLSLLPLIGRFQNWFVKIYS